MLGASMLAQAGQAGEPDRLLDRFAGCVGRFSAEMEFQWLMSDPTSEVTEAERGNMIALAEAISGPDDGRRILSLRIETKQAHKALLSRSAFDSDPKIRIWARARADHELAQCRGLMLSTS